MAASNTPIDESFSNASNLPSAHPYSSLNDQLLHGEIISNPPPASSSFLQHPLTPSTTGVKGEPLMLYSPVLNASDNHISRGSSIGMDSLIDSTTLTTTTSSTKMPMTQTIGTPNTTVVLPAFLTKTYEIFSREDYRHICAWNDAGDTIIIKRPTEFTDEILPQYFKHQNFPSFIRQLNMYGFHKSVLDSNRREFQHPFFKRGRKDLLYLIKRKANVSTPVANQHQNDSALAKYDSHRESSDALLEELRAVRQRSDALESRLRHIEMDSAVIRNENSKLWSAVEASKLRQLSMQNKMKKILWILFEIFRNHNASKNTITLGNQNTEEQAILKDEFASTSRLTDFRDILHYLDMDDPPLIGDQTTDVLSGQSSFNQATAKSTVIEEVREAKRRKIADVLKLPAPTQSPPLYTCPKVTDRIPQSVAKATSNSNDTLFLEDEQQKAKIEEKDDQNKQKDSTSEQTVASTSALSLFSPLLSEKFIPKDALSTLAASIPSSPNVTPSLAVEWNTLDGSHDNSESSTFTATKDMKEEKNCKLLNDMAEYNVENEEVRKEKLLSYKHVMQKLEDFECDLLDAYDAETLDTLLASHVSDYGK